MTTTPVVLRSPTSTRTFVRLPDLLLLAIVMVIAAALVGRGNFTVDESAYRAQAAWVEDGAWLQPYAVPDLGPGAEPAPLANSALTERGWAAYSKAPLYILILVAARQVDPAWGPVGVSIIGLLLLCWASGRLSDRLAPGSSRFAFWLLGLASPFFLHGHIVWAHTLMAAAVAGAVLAVVRTEETDGLRPTLGAAVCIALAVLLRTEAVVFGAAVVGVGLLEFVRARTGAAMRMIVAGVAGTATGEAVNRLLMAALVGPGTSRNRPSSQTLLDDRLQSLWNNVLSPGLSWQFPITARLASVVVLASVAAHLRARRDDRLALLLLVALGVLLGVVGAGARLPYPAMLPVVPLVAIGVVAALGSELGPGHRRLGSLAALFTAATVLISEPHGGGLGWGGRYVMVTTVLLAPVAAVGLRRLVQRGDRVCTGLVVGSVLVTVAIQANGLLLLRSTHERSLAKAERVEADLGELGARQRLLLTTDISIGRSAPHTARLLPLLSVPSDEVLGILARIEAAGLDAPLLLGSRSSPPRSPGAGWVTGPAEELDFVVVAPLIRTWSPSGNSGDGP